MFNTDSSYSIIVAGGGLAGVCAAIAAARELRQNNSAERVALINDRPVLGGVSSSEIRVPPIGAGRNPYGFETGIISEILYEERKRNHNRWEMGTANSIWDIILWEFIKAEPLIDLYLNTTVFQASTEDHKITTIECLQLGNEKKHTMQAKIFIDCTGDSTLAHLAGANYLTGRESQQAHQEGFAPPKEDQGHMGSSLLFQAKDMGFPCPFEAPPYAAKYLTEDSLCFRPHQNFKNGYYWIEVGIPYDTIENNEEIRDELLRHVLGVWDHLKNHCKHFGKEVENWALDWVGMVPGKRGSRRLIGDYILNANDLKNMNRFHDQVAFGGHFFDLHTMGGILAADKPGNPVDTDPDLWDRCRLKPYPIPFRCLYSNNIQNLLMAGRNISTSHVANGSTRVMLTNSLLGQAVGTASAICSTENITPRVCGQEKIFELQQTLLKNGCFLHQIRNEDPKDLSKKAKITATDSLPLRLPPNQETIEKNLKNRLDKPLCTILPLNESPIEGLSFYLENKDNEICGTTLSIKSLEHLWDIQNQDTPSPYTLEQEIEIPPNFNGVLEIPIQWKRPSPFVQIALKETKQEVYWKFRRDHLPGCYSAWQSLSSGYWKYLRHKGVEGFELQCLEIKPTPFCYEAQELTTGINRPFDRSNTYLSNRLPATIELEWPKAIIASEIHLTFDTDLSKTNETMRAFEVSPKCIKKYEVNYLDKNGLWKKWFAVEKNYQRLNQLKGDQINTSKIQITLQESHGAPYASLHEIRIY